LVRTVKSSRVVVSPLISAPEATCFKRRRMILPERVFGKASAKRNFAGAGFRQGFGEADIVGFGDGADFFGDVGAEFITDTGAGGDAGF
jgi:hypothetical protein